MSNAKDQMITVCSECLRASCWQGIFYCESAKNASTVEKSIDELNKLGLENPDYWNIPEQPQKSSKYPWGIK